ncbi:eukaryotic translation initiation factor 4E type 3 [Ptiloglossa arizonensis]|uniref:eukaryotic translation initiation factor 4E type 3 n=1 Tax=Ptiloglossa arizonensis TaxID=3350558 RepID=UPI003FA0FD39
MHTCCKIAKYRVRTTRVADWLYIYITFSNMAAVEYESKDDNSADLSKTPVLSDETVKTIEEHETSDIPLQSSWTFWLDKVVPGTTVEEYKENLMKIYTVNTVQSFWAVFNNIPNASAMEVRYSYHLMRDERYPLWEEPVNQKGGTWRLKCQKTDSEQIWKEMVLAAIGEQFSECMAEDDEICGVTVSIKDKEDLIQIWNTNASLASKATIIQKVHLLLPNVNFVEFYKSHQSHYAYGRR